MIKNLKFKISNFVAKLQRLPEDKKKIIFFGVIAVSVVVIGFFEIMITRNNLRQIGNSLGTVQIPQLDLQDDRYDMPEIGGMNWDMPDSTSTVSEDDSEALRLEEDFLNRE